MKICIVTDSNVHLSKEEIGNLPIYILRMPILIDGVPFFEDEDIDEATFFKELAFKDVRTSQPAPQAVCGLWDELLEKYDQVVHIPFSSGLSSATQTAAMLAEDYKGKVFVVDNHRVSVTLKRSIFDAINLINDGKSAEEIKKILEETKAESSIYIMVDTLTYLKKGGRVNATAAAIGNTIHLKPILEIQGGVLNPVAAGLGTKKAKKIMIEKIHRDIANKFKDVPAEDLEIGMAYTHDLKEANIFKEEVSKEFNIKDIIMDPLSLQISAHIGPGALAITVSKIIR